MMTVNPAFDLVSESFVPEIDSQVRRYRHKKTGADVLSLVNDDENKVFGIAFSTPPEDSTGIAHILEHSVLCGSEKFPVKKPFVEMLKGSLHTFLNAMTYPDKTVYPVASQNLADFYNLTQVYLDAVFFPLLTPETFLQEGWHYELEDAGAPLAYKGVVFNEMKGVYSSPDSVFRVHAQGSLFPDTIYGHSSGGDPRAMPDLTYEAFSRFHRQHYHPSNARIFFSGNDDPGQRLEILEDYLARFERTQPADAVAPQTRFSEPRWVEKTYPGPEDNPRSGFVSVNWMLDPAKDPEENFERTLLFQSLIGTTAAPLYKALTDSGLGEAVLSGSAGGSYLQPWLYAGLRGVDPRDAGKVEALILQTLEDLAKNGIDKETVEAALNTLEFQLRERNTGGYPRGLAYFLSGLGEWLYGGDPLDGLRFEAPLTALKSRLIADNRLLERGIETLLLQNAHRTTLVLRPDAGQEAREAEEERARLDAARAQMGEAEVAAAIETTQRLKALQNAADRPEDLAKIPTLTLEDLPRQGASIPTEETLVAGVRTLRHPIATSGIVYLDLGFDLKTLPARLLPYLPLFAQALTQTGTEHEDFVALSQRIGRATGGIGARQLDSGIVDRKEAAAWLIVRGKATRERVGDLFGILKDLLVSARLGDRDRIRQLVAQSKARFEAGLVPSGHIIAISRLRGGLGEPGWLNETASGISQLFFLRELAGRIESDWDGVRGALEEIRALLVNAEAAIANVTADPEVLDEVAPRLEGFLGGLPRRGWSPQDWGPLPGPRNEGLTIPAQVNYVAKGASLADLGFSPSGALSVVTKHLGTSYLWDKVRVEGGAYGGFAGFNSLAGSFVFGSYRDPNLVKTLEVYDAAAEFLRKPVSREELTRSVIGTIGDLDPHLLPDAKGYTALVRALTGVTDDWRQRRREEALEAGPEDFVRAAEMLAAVARDGHVVALGSDKAIAAANAARGGFLEVTKVL